MIAFTKRALITEHRSAVIGVIVVLFLFTGTTFPCAQQSPQEDVKQLVRSTIDNELNGSHQDEGRWTYRLGVSNSARNLVKIADRQRA